MPFITIDLFEGRSPEAKAAIAQEVTQTILKHTNAPKEAIHIIIKDLKEGEYYPAGKMKEKQ